MVGSCDLCFFFFFCKGSLPCRTDAAERFR